jgi:hypothetical protein
MFISSFTRHKQWLNDGGTAGFDSTFDRSVGRRSTGQGVSREAFDCIQSSRYQVTTKQARSLHTLHDGTLLTPASSERATAPFEANGNSRLSVAIRTDSDMSDVDLSLRAGSSNG